jgi:hypothetical protein
MAERRTGQSESNSTLSKVLIVASPISRCGCYPRHSLALTFNVSNPVNRMSRDLELKDLDG